MLLLGQLYTDNTNDNANDDDDDDDDSDTQWTNHDCIGSLECMPNEPKTVLETVDHSITNLIRLLTGVFAKQNFIL